MREGLVERIRIERPQVALEGEAEGCRPGRHDCRCKSEPEDKKSSAELHMAPRDRHGGPDGHLGGSNEKTPAAIPATDLGRAAGDIDGHKIKWLLRFRQIGGSKPAE